jgi:hypothetical protein
MAHGACSPPTSLLDRTECLQMGGQIKEICLFKPRSSCNEHHEQQLCLQQATHKRTSTR